MENTIQIIDALKNVSIIPLAIFIFSYLIFIVVDNFNVTNIEVRLMTPKKRFLIPVAYFSVVAIILSLVVTILNINEFRKQYDQEPNSYLSFGWMLVIFVGLMFVIVLGFCFFVFVVAQIIGNIIAINYNYYTEDGWKLLRVNSEGVLVVEKKNVTTFISEPYSQNYYSEIASGDKKLEFYGNKKKCNWTCLLLLSTCFCLCIKSLDWITENKIMSSLILFLLSIILLCTMIIIFESNKSYKGYKQKIKVKKYKLKNNIN